MFRRILSSKSSEPAAEKAIQTLPDSEYLPDLSIKPMRPAGFSTAENGRHETLLKRPSLSAVIGSYNRLELLKIAIDSVRAQCDPDLHEIIVVDGGSTDGSIEWLTAQSDIVSIIQHNRLKTAKQKYRRKSWGEFMNMGFRAAAGDYILMISDDCLLLPDAIQNGLERIQRATDAGHNVGACAFYFRNWPQEDRYYVQRTIGGNLMLNHGIYLKRALAAANWAEEDEYVFYKADTDLALKMWAAGFVTIDAPGSICEHFIGKEDPIRDSNNELIEADRSAMKLRWPELVTKEGVEKIGRIYSERRPDSLADRLFTPHL